MKIKCIVYESPIDIDGKFVIGIYICEPNGNEMSPVEIMNTVDSHLADAMFLSNTKLRSCRAVFVTGSEPTSQADIIEFLVEARKRGYYIVLGTNGTNFKIFLEIYNLVDEFRINVNHGVNIDATKRFLKVVDARVTYHDVLGNAIEQDAC